MRSHATHIPNPPFCWMAYIAMGFAIASLASCSSGGGDPTCPDGGLGDTAACLGGDAGSSPGDGGVALTCSPACEGEKPLCDRARGVCAECLESAHCTDVESSYCSAAGRCVGCRSDEDCKHHNNALACNLATRTCVECVTSEHCPAERSLCDETRNRCVQCFSSDDCGSDALCDLGTNTCVDCLENTDCPTGRVCHEEAHVCVECSEDIDCRTNPVTSSVGRVICNPSTHECVACTRDEHCADPHRPACNPETHTCGRCTDHSDCAGFSELPSCHLALGTCVECTPETEASACGAYSCHPTTRRCTTTPRESLGPCDYCTADSECEGSSKGEAACVRVHLQGYRSCMRAQKSFKNNRCPVGYPNSKRAEGTNSPSQVYCFHNENLITCQEKQRQGKSCPSSSSSLACGLRGGACIPDAEVGGNMCTYRCSADDECEFGKCLEGVKAGSSQRYCCTWLRCAQFPLGAL